MHKTDVKNARLPRTLTSCLPTRTHPGRHQILHRRRSNSSSDNNWEVQIPLNHLRQVFMSAVSQKPARAKRAIRIPVGKRSAPWSKGKKRGFQNPTSHPLYLFSIPSLRLSFTGPYCSFVIMECRTPPTLKKELPISPAILLRSPSFFDMFQALCCLTYSYQGTKNAPADSSCVGSGRH